MSCNYSKSEVGEIHDALKSMVGSLLRKGFSVESVAEAFIRQSRILQTAIDDEPARPSYTSHNGSRGYRTQESRPSASYQGHPSYSTYSDYGRDSGYSSSHSSNTGSRGYRTREYRPGGYSHSSYTAPTPSGTKPEEDLYMVLGVSKTTSAEQIKSAHRKLCLKHHPDRATSGPYAKKAATELMARINQANDVLKDQKLRAYYDRTGLIAAEL